MPTLALTYFDMPGRARVLRKALALGGVAIDDRALPADEIRALKPSTPYGMVPILAIDGQVLAESQAILRYIGRLTGMYPPPTEPLASAMVDEIIDSLDDINERLLIPTYQEDNVDKRKEMRLHLIAGPLRKALELIDTRLQQIQRLPFFRDHSEWLFIHELLVWDYATKLRSSELDHIPPTFIDAFVAIVAVFEKVEKKTSVTYQRPLVADAGNALPLSKLKLTHFDSAERADPVRLAFHIGGIAFEDERLSRQEFSMLKPAFPNGQLPVLTMGDQICAQSFSILRYAGTLGRLYPAGDFLAAAKIDEVLSHIGELYFFFDPEFQDQRPAEKESIREALVTDVVPESLAALDTRLAQWNNNAATPFAMGGDALTIADLAIYGLVELLTSDKLDYMPNAVVAPHKHVLRAHEAVRQHPRVQDWFAQATPSR